MTKSLIGTCAYAALYCCIWFAPGIIVVYTVSALFCYIQLVDGDNLRKSLKKGSKRIYTILMWKFIKILEIQV